MQAINQVINRVQQQRNTPQQVTGEIIWPQPCRDTVDWFFAELKILVGVGSFEREFPPDGSEQVARLKWSNVILGGPLIEFCSGSELRNKDGSSMSREQKKERFRELVEIRRAELARALNHIRDNGGMDFLNVGKVIQAVEESRPAPYHKPFDSSRAIEHTPLPNETNKSEMAKLRERLAI